MLEKITLPHYTKSEELLNSVSHFFGVILGIASSIMFIKKSTNVNSIVGSLIFGLSIIFLYTSSTLYHSLKRGIAKKIMRLIDHSVIYILISGTCVGLSLICIYQYSKIFTVSMSTVSLLLSTIGIILSFIDQEKYKKVQLILYLVVGWISVMLVYPIYKYCENGTLIILLSLAGGIVYSVGMVFYIIGKKKKYFHSIFHLFVLSGTIIHIITAYFSL